MKTNQQLSFKYILTADNNWSLFKSIYQKELRPDIIQEVEKMLNCCNPKNGFATYICPNCGQTITVPFSCKSKICTTCGKKYTDIWADKLSKKLLNVAHYHITLTVSDKLWPYIQTNTCLQKLLLDTAPRTISRVFSEKNKEKVKIIPGQIWVLHPFGDDLKAHYHVHGLVTIGGLSKKNLWIPADFIPYAVIRNYWQYDILTAIRKLMPPSLKLNAVIDWCFRNHENGFYIFVRKINGSQKNTLKYIARYIRHPAIANSRITAYDGTNVTFTYDDHGKQSQKTMPKFAFINAVLQHVLPKQFKTTRCTGLYSRRSKAKHEITSRILQSFNPNPTNRFNWRRNVTNLIGKDPLICDNCNNQMYLYQITYPTPNGYKTIDVLNSIIRKGGINYAQPPPPIKETEKIKEQECRQVHMF